jgi:homoserine kinase
VFVPATQIPTAKARRLLPEQLPFTDAARSAGRAALLTAALSGRPELLLAATEDRLHQSYRAAAMPRSAALVDQMRAQGVAAVISGAGPTVLALTDSLSAARVEAQVPRGWAAHRLDVDQAGARIVPL